MIRRSVFGGGNIRRPNRWTYFSEGIAKKRESEPCTQAPFAYGYGGQDNRDAPNPNTVASEEPEDHLESESADGNNGGQPESSATVAKRGAPPQPLTPRTLRTYGTAHTSRTVKASTRAPQRPRDSQTESSATAAKRGAPRVPQTPRTL